MAALAEERTFGAVHLCGRSWPIAAVSECVSLLSASAKRRVGRGL
jgi:hypothetical protein